MASKRFYLTFVEKNVRGIIEPYWDNAPVTCETIWNALAKPIRVPASHAMFAGPEIMTGLPKEAQTFDPRGVPAENQTCFPIAGECLWFYQAPNLMKGLTDEFWEIGMFYDNGGRIFGPLGWTPCNIFGRMTEGLEAVAEACRSIRVEGIKTVEIGRIEG
ncbi:DUF3830 family protein [Chelatococcus asaccharovorans]|uniref:Uncharacterized protein DUF3830 n=1 Tax=Chelatococcus asaccharovorans TaxID=28210 RepID=A0A2V3U2U8_9HYPH|nr:DUF3830 family protein [Chelatococcus asaccharovorans]MBS7702183.1 DUF3830 family protein [Chelatococcus asaccharovorans]PXW56619.1 uncharacterized protein DUF3830 [Chelatococcus asaccharovorans]CAH1668478.1 conserved hypothetical protein [Chelatococcus asaccharovorans]CAH1680053.1 conserved hypothetical protein [Chelatococcus asaccharovorans]